MILCIPFLKDDISWFEIIYSSIIPVLLFFAGLWFSKLVEKHKVKTKQKRLVKYFYTLIKQLSKKLSSQIQLLKEAATRQDDPNESNLMTEIASGESHLLLRDIDRNELFESFVLSKKKGIEHKTEQFEKIISEIDFVYKAITTLETNVISIPGIIGSQIDAFNRASLSITGLINEYKSQLNDESTPDNLTVSIQELLNSLESEKGEKQYLTNIDSGYEIFVNPLILLLKHHSKDPRATTLMKYAGDLKFAYTCMKNERQKNKEYFNKLASDLENSKNLLDNIELK